MKLNKKGWGTLDMFLLCGGLLIALLVAVYFIGKLYGSLDNAVGNKGYIDLENKLESAARQYVILNNISTYDNQIIAYSTIKNAGLIDSLIDEKGHSCNGYVKITIIDNISHYVSYISCPNYETKTN